MTGRDAARVAERCRLLEIEAAVQRAAFSATIAKWENRRVLLWSAKLAGVAAQTFALPRIRWLVIGSVLSRLRRWRRR